MLHELRPLRLAVDKMIRNLSPFETAHGLIIMLIGTAARVSIAAIARQLFRQMGKHA